MVWIQFVVCLVIIIFAGSKLSKYGDIIAEKTGMGRVWVGIVLLATITSLPEVATGASSVAIIKVPDLALGDLFGSSLINLAIIAMIDVFYRRGPILHLQGTGITLVTILNMLLIAATSASIFLANDVFSYHLFDLFGVYSPLLLGIFLVSQYMLFRFKTRQPNLNDIDQVESEMYVSMSLAKTIIWFIITGIVIVGAGIWLSFIGDQIADSTGLKASFVGTLFLAISTSAPEIVVSISAVRIDAVEMAVANVIGSNLFNMGAIVFLDDLFFAGGPLLSHVSIGHVLTGLFALMMSSVVIIGIVFRPKFWMKSWIGIDTAFIAILYIAALAALYFIGL